MNALLIQALIREPLPEMDTNPPNHPPNLITESDNAGHILWVALALSLAGEGLEHARPRATA